MHKKQSKDHNVLECYRHLMFIGVTILKKFIFDRPTRNQEQNKSTREWLITIYTTVKNI